MAKVKADEADEYEVCRQLLWSACFVFLLYLYVCLAGFPHFCSHPRHVPQTTDVTIEQAAANGFNSALDLEDTDDDPRANFAAMAGL
jgi:hypothetical protein